ncbi:ESPR-type extended signal peptide-containing protein [Paraburkholderia terrae]|uniref:Adhesin n=1 Tax=Paraburkholderia terrae TaxID=311230 RepID=A0A2I8EHA9_9BURK|nr:ESPR-type extended signal peptide-containing protein [Paraburkholderia terrae]AUT58976.1 hypothetical protein C2L65_04715 [Paraburkholderia terrae]
MNKTYRNVWCAKTGTFIAAAETARAKGKSARSGMRALTCATLLTLGGVAGAAHAGALDGGSTLGGIAADIAYGSGAQTTNAAGGKAAVAIGQNASASNLSGATPNADGTVAVGDSASATDGGVAVGGASYAGSMSTAVGAGATAAMANSVALGANSVANSTTLGTAGFAPVGGTAISAATAAGEVSVGQAGAERRITNVAAGLNPTDAVNVSQLMSEDAKVNNISNNLSNVINGGGIKYFHVNSTQADSVASNTASIAIGPNAYASGPYTIAMGSASTASGGNSIALGVNSVVAANNSLALGPNATTTGTLSIAVGASANVVASQGAVAIGNAATASNAMNAVVMGTGASAIGPGGSDANQSLAMGYFASVTGNSRAMALGASATTSGSGSVAIGGMANASANNSVALGGASTTTANLGAAGYNPGSGTLSGTASAANGEVSVGSAGKERRVTNVAAGSAATDAVNVSQLQSEAAKVNAQGAATAAALGGDSTYNSTTGAITNPTYVVGGSTINNVAGAISNIDARTTQNSSDITNLATAINSGELRLVQQDATTRNITVARSTDGTIIDFAGTAGARKLTGVLAGNVGALSTDAVNGSQLYSLANATASAIGGGSTVNSDGSISAPSYVIGGTTMNNIAGTITNIDARTTQNASDITSIDARTTQIAGDVTNLDARTTQIAGDVTNLDARTTQMSSDITNLTTAINSGELGLVQQDDTTRNITVAKNTDGTIIDFTGTAGARKLTGVLAGNVSASSVDAVNGSQLYSLANATANAIGGGSTVNGDGSISAPSYVIGGTTMNSIAGTITNIDARTTQNSSEITSIDARTTQIAGDVTNLDARTTQMSSDITNLTTAINSGDLGLVQQDDTTRNITVAKTTDGTIVDFTGTAGARKLTGVLAGNVSASSVDAVNGSQLYSVANSTASAIGGGSTVNSDGSISKPSYVIGGTTVNSIGGAVTNIDARTTQLANDVTNLTTSINNGGLGLVEQDATTRNITVAKATDGTIVDFTGTMGARKLTGVHAGDVNASSADAVNGSQLYSLANSTASAIGGGSTVNSDGSISAPSYVIGGTTMNSIAGAITNIDARTTQNASDISSINTALNNITSSGTGIKYFHTNSMLADSQATGSESVAIGGAAVATAANSVALGSNSVANRANTVSVGSAGAERQITNVAAGTADTDAVNVAQLKATGLVGTDGAAKAAVTYDSNVDGSVSYSSVTMGNGVAGGTTIHNVAAGTIDTDAVNVAQMNSALANVTNIAMNAASGSPTFATNGDGSTAAAKATGHHATAMGSNAQASADNSVALGADSVADRENTVSVGSKGHERQITNVAAGTQGTDAVNVDQLNETVAGAVGNLPAGMSAKDYTDQRFNSMQNTVNQVAKNSYAGVAAAMAMPNMTPSQPGNTVVAAGAGSYKSGAALGVGATYRSRNSKWLVNGAVSVTSTGDAGVRAQVGYEF